MSEVETGKSNPSAKIGFGLVTRFPELNQLWIWSGSGSMVENSAEEEPGTYEVKNKRAERIGQFISEWMATQGPDEQAWLEIQIKNAVPQYAEFLINRSED